MQKYVECVKKSTYKENKVFSDKIRPELSPNYTLFAR